MSFHGVVLYPSELALLLEVEELSEGTTFHIERSVFGGLDVAVDQGHHGARQNWRINKGSARQTQENGRHL